jgi:hypothetical protein
MGFCGKEYNKESKMEISQMDEGVGYSRNEGWICELMGTIRELEKGRITTNRIFELE